MAANLLDAYPSSPRDRRILSLSNFTTFQEKEDVADDVVASHGHAQHVQLSAAKCRVHPKFLGVLNGSQVIYYFLARLRLETAIRKAAPSPIPAMIDPTGKPGMRGPTNPVEMTEVAVVVVVAVAVEVLVPYDVVPVV